MRTFALPRRFGGRRCGIRCLHTHDQALRNEPVVFLGVEILLVARNLLEACLLYVLLQR